MKRTLLILRHGKSDWEAEYSTDFERPLAKRGQKAAKLMGSFIADEGLDPKIIISSTANRALSTAKAVVKQLGDIERLSSDQLYLGDLEDFFDVLATIPADVQCALLVGHNPGLENLVDDLCGSDDAVLKTCSLAVVKLGHCNWQDIDGVEGKLAGLYHPRDLLAQVN